VPDGGLTQASASFGIGGLTHLEIKTVLVEALHCDPANARRHNKKNLRAIMDSLSEFGQVEPLVVEKGTGLVIGGNGRLAAAVEMGQKEVQVVEVDVHGADATRLGIALNRTGELAEWDAPQLASLFASVGEIPGLTADDVAKICQVNASMDPLADYGRDRAGSSPWERVGGADRTTVLFSFGEIQAKIPMVFYERFLALTPEADVADHVVRMIEVYENEICNS